MRLTRPASPRLFSAYVDEFDVVGALPFESDIDAPMLLVRSTDGGDGALERGFETGIIDRADIPLSRDERLLAEQAPPILPGHVLPISKREGGVFRDRVGIGRTANVDVRITLPLVSKYHAFFTCSADGWTLTDADSSNGTFARGERLAPRVATLVSDADEVAFGPYRFSFHLPRGFVRLVQGRARTR